MNIKLVVRKALPTRPRYLDNKIEDKNPNNGRKIINSVILIFKAFGGGGIRTHEEKFSLVFKTRAFDHSATPPEL